MDAIVLDKISKSFHGKDVLKNFSAVFPMGKTTCIMAPSGAGKTTLLHILMGLERQDSGQIHGLHTLRKSAVFQEDRLCDALTPASLDEEQVLSAMQAVGLRGCEKQPCRELSGGMRRRVALLRALMANYDILFLDEPFKGLDEETKTAAIYETRRRCQGCTVILFNHDPTEINAMGVDQVICL